MNSPKQVNTLLALPDVAGLFILNENGDLLLNRLPDPFGDELFAELGPHLTSFIDTIGSSYNPTDEMLFGFAGYCLYARCGKGLILGILTKEHPNLMGLRVGANLLMKQIKPETLQLIQESSAAESVRPDKTSETATEANTPTPKKQEERTKKKRSAFNDIWG